MDCFLTLTKLQKSSKQLRREVSLPKLQKWKVPPVTYYNVARIHQSRRMSMWITTRSNRNSIIQHFTWRSYLKLDLFKGWIWTWCYLNANNWIESEKIMYFRRGFVNLRQRYVSDLLTDSSVKWIWCWVKLVHPSKLRLVPSPRKSPVWFD